MKAKKEIQSAGFCIVRPDLVAQNLRVPVGTGYPLDAHLEKRPHPYRWLNDTEGFEIFIHNRWENAESIDFEFLDKDIDIIKAHFKGYTYGGAMQELDTWSAKELKQFLRHCGYPTTYVKDIMVGMVKDLARLHAWKTPMEVNNPFLKK